MKHNNQFIGDTTNTISMSTAHENRFKPEKKDDKNAKK